METPEYVFSPPIEWNAWNSTGSYLGEIYFISYTKPFATLRSVHSVNDNYPGFFNALQKLESLGCDEFFVTSILKYCMLHSADERMDIFLERTFTDKVIQTAVSIGLSGEGLLSTLAQTSSQANPDLPVDILMDRSF